jgi:hypothetical protein
MNSETDAVASDLAGKLITFLETGTSPDGLFSPEAFVDLTVPQWRLQARGADGVVSLRLAGHPAKGRVPRSRLDITKTGFVLEVEETWEADGDSWYCRELFRADITDGAISEMSVYCTGDWDSATVTKHAQSVSLLRP